MSLLVFVYDFPHAKSNDGLEALLLAGLPVVGAIAAPWMPLNTSIAAGPPQGRPLARQLADSHSIPWFVGPHESDRVAEVISSTGATRGVVLGARILSHAVVHQFRQGVVNVHPGIAPANRGLDAVPWAVLNRIPQGVTVHAIGKRIDGGPVIRRRLVTNIRGAQSLAELASATRVLEVPLLVDALTDETPPGRVDAQVGPYHSKLSNDDLHQAAVDLPEYLLAYDKLCDDWRDIEVRA